MKKWAILGLCLLFSAVLPSVWASYDNIRFPLPGKTAATVLLQQDTLPAVLGASVALNASCEEDATVVDTAVTVAVKNPIANAQGILLQGRWQEVWQLQCADGEMVSIPITFTADGEGGAYYNIQVLH